MMHTNRREFLRAAVMGLPLVQISTRASQNILELPPPPPGDKIAYAPGEFQFGELRLPEGAGPHPVVIVIHGGYWRGPFRPGPPWAFFYPPSQNRPPTWGPGNF